MVRMYGPEGTSMFEVIVVEEVGDTLELRLQQWDPHLEPRTPEPTLFELVEVGERAVKWKAVADGAQIRSLGYRSPTNDTFVISVQLSNGEEMELELTAK